MQNRQFSHKRMGKKENILRIVTRIKSTFREAMRRKKKTEWR